MILDLHFGGILSKMFLIFLEMLLMFEQHCWRNLSHMQGLPTPGTIAAEFLLIIRLPENRDQSPTYMLSYNHYNIAV